MGHGTADRGRDSDYTPFVYCVASEEVVMLCAMRTMRLREYIQGGSLLTVISAVAGRLGVEEFRGTAV
jgi:hypothetical protein